jgi:dihydroorotate dehydrogenase (fumarate)
LYNETAGLGNDSDSRSAEAVPINGTILIGGVYMADLTTSYLGLKLENPVIISSSRLTDQLKGLQKSAAAGAGAVVLKSIFEEQIEYDSRSMIKGMDDFSSHADAYDFLANSSKDYYIDRYLDLVEKAKAALGIPVIASVNCVSQGAWLDYADRFQEVGADALEINMFIVPSQTAVSGADIEQQYIDLIRKILAKVSIPVAVKLGYHFSGMANFMKQLDELGVSGLVLFNRYYRPDIDIEKIAMKAGDIVSVEQESALSLQWTALLSGQLSCDICANTGIHTGDAVIKHLLAGASAVEICSAIMKFGYGTISDMKKTLSEWMGRKGFDTLDDFRGLLSKSNTDSPEVWERTQYIKAVTGIS